MPSSLDLRCYFVTGQPAADVARVASAAAAGGAGVIQVRSKPIAEPALERLACEVADAVAAANPRTRVLIDDNVPLAAHLMQTHHIHGAHIGLDDMDPRAARELLGPNAILGLTTGTLALVEAANAYADVIDYVGAGPFRPTPTKDSGRAPLGLDGYPPLVAASKVPVVAIGDVHASDAAALAATGVAGVAIVRGFMRAEDPRAMAAGIVKDFEAAS
ncbi:thiamine-phosphate pyrophosphorylase [Corynebacterium imitans]|uniref:Thiamine-phosphate synthase n=1 Tax=Corynebacterium imitans TaxID=156978 RepID=A0A076NHV7_9CORY|nr:thiamine phosphate synthase [Corynebacterium imitans]AIJ32963.1 thiamine-phosphate pyrophosphorylase [Corynebacterium imitans]SNV60462.1 thiamine-phosphate pyrophosphorylase [Corynebacterium imitans]